MDKIQSLTGDPKRFWKKLKETLGKSKSQSNNVTPDTWVSHFSSLNKNDPETLAINRDRCVFIEGKLGPLSQQVSEDPCPIMDKKFTLGEILNGIKFIKKGKSSALDAISNDILHCAARTSAAPVLTAVFNNLLKFQFFPIQWATGIIVPLHKSGELDDPNNYRGITLNSCISKLFTLLLNNRLTKWCDDKGLISYNQIGFRKGFRTSDHVFTLKTLIDDSFKNKQKLYACFVDFKKAYDTVWRKGLFYKLLSYGISSKFVNLMKDMYSGIQLCISLSNGLSMPFKSLVGLKQGCNLSPLLFNIFINDIPMIIDDSNCDPPALGNQTVSCLLYADDLVLLSKSRTGLQNAINALNQFSKDWFLEVNQTKTKCLVFSKGRKSQIPQFTIGDQILNFCEEYCYLGVIFTRSGSFNSASRALTDKAAGAMFSIIRSIYKHRSVDLRIMLDLFDKMVLPIALYGCEVWGVNFIPTNTNNNDFFSNSWLSKHMTENLQYRFLKLLLGVPRRTSNWAVCTEMGRFPLIIKALKHLCKYYTHLVNTDSPLIKAALEKSKHLSELGINSWYKATSRIFEFAGIEIGEVGHDLSTKLNYIFTEKWDSEREGFLVNSKLDVLASLKDEPTISSYLTSNICPAYKRAIAKVRLSAHKLPIETERYTNVPRLERVCALGCKALGDEVHYLFACEHRAIHKVYSPIIASINVLMPAFGDMSNKEKLKVLLNNKEFNILTLAGKLCHKVLTRFKETTW